MIADSGVMAYADIVLNTIRAVRRGFPSCVYNDTTDGGRRGVACAGGWHSASGVNDECYIN